MQDPRNSTVPLAWPRRCSGRLRFNNTFKTIPRRTGFLRWGLVLGLALGVALSLGGCGGTPAQPESAATNSTGASPQPTPTPANPPPTEAQTAEALNKLEQQIDAQLAQSPTTDVVPALVALLQEFHVTIARGPGSRAGNAAIQRDLGYERALQRLQDENTLLNDVAPLVEAREFALALELIKEHPLYGKYRPEDLPRLQRERRAWATARGLRGTTETAPK